MRRAPALGAALLIGLAACGDSTGPGSVDSDAALQSLTLGLQGLSEEGTFTFGSLNDHGFAPLVGQVNITINGKSQGMFALGLRQTFPAGTCVETVFQTPDFPPEPGVCTSLPDNVILLLWQTRSAHERPTKLLIVAGEVGTTDFGFDFTDGSEPALGGAFYTDGGDELWISTDGSLTSAVTPTSQSCTLPLPPFAQSGTCNIATFDEEGSAILESFSLSSTTPKTMSISIPRQTIHGILQAITEVKPIIVGASAQRAVTALGR